MIIKRSLKMDRNRLVPKMRSMYAVDSESHVGLTYVAHDGEFAMIWGWKAIWCDIKDLPELVEECKDTDIYEELKDVAEDVINYRRDLLIYEQGGKNDEGIRSWNRRD